MKGLAWLLLLANLLALAWWQGWLDTWLPTGREPQRLAAQVQPQRLQPVPASELEAARASVAERCIEVVTEGVLAVPAVREVLVLLVGGTMAVAREGAWGAVKRHMSLSPAIMSIRLSSGP